MTAQGLLLLLEDLGVALAPDVDGNLQYLAPAGALTGKLKALVRAHKPALVQLLRERTPPAAALDAATPPGTVWRRWVTGQTPTTFPLPAPRYHDTPSAPVTYWGALCTKKACRSKDPDATQSLRYFPSETCVSCWERWDKQVTEERPRVE